MEKTFQNEKKLLNEFKEKGISYAIFTYDAGNDSFNDMVLDFYDTNDKLLEINDSGFETLVEDLIFKNCTFYEASDGHYMGESGTVTISIEEDDDEEYFNFDKDTKYAYNENILSEIEIILTPIQLDFVENYVSNINGETYSDVNINYKTDFIINNERQIIINELCDLIEQKTSEFIPEDILDLDEYYDYDSSENADNTLELRNDKLILYINNRYTEYRFD